MSPRLPDDFPLWKRHVDKKLRELFTMAASRPPLNRVKAGDFIVDGGNIIVRLGGMIIDGLGRIDIMNGGSLLLRDKQAREVFYAGGLNTEGFGAYLRRLDGSIALMFSDDDPAAEQVQRIRLQDRNNRMLLSEDRSGNGFEYPLLPFTTYVDDYAHWGASTDSAFKPVAGAQQAKHQPRCYLRVRHTTDVSGTTGELRVTVGGSVIPGSVTAVGFVINTTTMLFDLPGNMGDLAEVKVEARRTAGTGAVRAEIVLCVGFGSTG